MPKYLISCFLFLLLDPFVGFGQQIPNLFGKINIASPNAAALGKYGDFPVNNHTGIPNISIPLYTIKEGNLSLPLSLSYHASGIRVEENASWVGAGWSFNAGGVITRTVKSKPDERRTQSLQQEYGHLSNNGIANYIFLASPGSFATTTDSEPDLFSFNFNGNSGKFYFDDNKNPVLYPEQDFKIEYVYKDEIWNNSPGYPIPGSIGKSIESFVITDPEGTRYYFGIPESTVSAPYTSPVEVVSSYTSSNGMIPGKVISSWYLYKIVSADGVNVIHLFYKTDKYSFYTYPGSTYGQSGSNSNSYYPVKNFMQGVQLSRIVSSGNRIELEPGITRLDLSRWETGLDEGIMDYTNNSSKSLGSIKIYDTGTQCIKKYSFAYTYFEDNVTPDLNYFTGIYTDKRRLKLIQLQESSGDGSIILPPYQFNYFEEFVPRRLSFGKDHWGFINGANNNTMLYPEIFDNRGSLNAMLNISINNRETAWPAMRAGGLKRITFPTGGTTDFEFEPNSVYSSGYNRMVGGLRIKSITTFDPVSNNSIKTEFEYNRVGSNMSSGFLFSKPVYIQLIRNDKYKKIFSPSNGCSYFLSNETMLRDFMLSDNSIRPMELTQGNHIGYEVVSIKKINSGRSTFIYQVRNSGQFNESEPIASTYINNPGACESTIPNYPAAPPSFNPFRGELLGEYHFDSNDRLLIKKEFQNLYNYSNYTAIGYLFAPSVGCENCIPLETWYELRSAKKIETSQFQTTYDLNGNKKEERQRTTYQSSYHNKPTSLISYNSNGDSLITRNSYAFDLKSESLKTIIPCNHPASSFLTFMDFSYINLGYPNILSLNYYQNDIHGFLQKITEYNNYVINQRKLSRQCQLDHQLQVEQINSNFKTNADEKLKPIIWLQDIYKNDILETSSWKNNELLKASLIEYKNRRDDEFGVYPDNLKTIDLQMPSLSHMPLRVSSDNKSVISDHLYELNTKVIYSKGKINNILSRDGINTAYDWNYNYQYPVVNITNAYNSIRDTAIVSTKKINVPVFLGSGSNQNKSIEVEFFHENTANIEFSMGVVPPSVVVNAWYYLTFPNNTVTSYFLCSSGSGSSGCNGIPNIKTLINMPRGKYKLKIDLQTTFDSYQFQFQAGYEYLGRTIHVIGDKEFFYEGFEDKIYSNTISANSFTGKKAFNGQFLVDFQLPNSRKYKLSWWKFENGSWKLNEREYQQGIILDGIIDEIRVYPIDAQMITYSYDSRYGIINVCDVNSRKTTYEYDVIGRLRLIKDHDGNIIKSLDYQYQAK